MAADASCTSPRQPATGTAECRQLNSEPGRGRKRSRSTTRRGSPRTDGSSTLRGRSRHRASSPFDSPLYFGMLQQASSLLFVPTITPVSTPAVSSRYRQHRREHCPSRGASPLNSPSLQPRSRVNRDSLQRLPDLQSGLRNGLLLPPPRDWVLCRDDCAATTVLAVMLAWSVQKRFDGT